MTNMRAVPPVPTEGDSFARRYAESRVDWATFWNAEFQVAEWCAEPVLPKGRAVAIFSPAGGGKSLFLLDVLARLATGQRVLAQRAGKTLRVLYFDMEMTDGDLLERLEDMGYGSDTDFSNLIYYLLPNLPPLDTAAGGEAVVALAREHEADVVAFDTTSRVISGKENDSDTLLAFYRFTGRPLKELGCTVVRLDHAGKDVDKGQRGTSAKNDDVDLVWDLRPRDGGITLHAKKRRQSWIPEHVELLRYDEPTLRHELAVPGETWPAGTLPCVQALDRLGAPIDIGTRAAQKLLRENGAGARREVIVAAVKYRRGDSDEPGTTPGTSTDVRPGTSAGNHAEPDSGTTPEPPGTTPRGEWEPRFLSREEPGSTGELCSNCQNNPAKAEQARTDLCEECWMVEVNRMLDDEIEEPGEPDVRWWADLDDDEIRGGE